MLGFSNNNNSLIASSLKYSQNSISDYEKLNRILINISIIPKLMNIIDKYMMTWGLLPPCTNITSITNTKKEYKFKNTDKYVFEKVCLDSNMFRYMNNKKNSDKYKGIFKQDNNDKNIWHVDLYGIENKNNTNNYSFYAGNYIYSYKFEFTKTNVINRLNENDASKMYDKISASLNNRIISYSTFLNIDNVFHVFLNKISVNQNVYNIFLKFEIRDINNFIILQYNNSYLVKNEKHNEFMERYYELLTNGLNIVLIPENIDGIISENTRTTANKAFHRIKKRVFGTSKTFKRIFLNVKLDELSNRLIIPKISLFSPDQIKYIVFKKNPNYSSGGALNINNKTIKELKNICKKNNIKNYSKLNKNSLIKILKKNKLS